MTNKLDFNTKELFSSYMKLVGVPHLWDEESSDETFRGKTLGLINGSAWIVLWSYYFGRIYLPGVKLVNVGNEAIQLNFMKAHSEGKECPPIQNIEAFARYAQELIDLTPIDAILITCSTMNRSLPYIRKAIEGHNVPVMQIDEPMMEQAVKNGGRVLIIATHGPTVNSTCTLIEETRARMKGVNTLKYTGATVENAFELLGQGKIEEHNEIIAETIRREKRKECIDQVVLAQLSMSIFKISYPDCEKEFGIPVLTSGEEGFKKIREILA